MATKRKSLAEITKRMIYLANKNFKCSQIIMLLALEQERKENPDLIRAISGLGDGCGFAKETCGILTGSACVLALYAGKGNEQEEQNEKLLPMLQELGDWFENYIEERYNSTKCNDIVGDQVGTTKGKKICGNLLHQTYNKTNEILQSYGFITG